MTLQLEYAFLPSPFPILASPQNGNPSVVSLQVIINNAQGLNVTLKAITIEITVGGDAWSDLSAAPNLPAPQYDATDQWTITSQGNQITLTPTNGETGTFTQAGVIFSLDGITVNHYEGTVPIKITEYLPSGGTISDDQTYSLVKKTAEYWVSNFRTVPSSLNDLNQAVTIYWQGSDEVVYDLYADDVLHQLDCVDTDHCYASTDGETGVTTSPFQISGVYTVTLDIIQVNSPGSRSLVDSLQINVNVQLPTLVEQSCIAPLIAYANQTVLVRWIALYATTVSVFVDGTLYDDNAPVDTYANGYPIALNSANNVTNIDVIAYSISKNTQDGHVFTINLLAPFQMIDLGNYYMQNSLYPVLLPVPQSTLVITVGAIQGYAALIDYQARTVTPLVLEQGSGYYAAITPDGQYLVYSSADLNSVEWVSIPQWGPPNILDTIPCGDPIVALQADPSQNQVWVVTANDTTGTVGSLDLAAKSLLPLFTLGQPPHSLAIAADGTVKVITMESTICVVAGGSQASFDYDFEVMRVFMTPDNQWVLVQVDETNILVLPLTLTPIHLPTSVTPIPTTGQVYRMVSTPDSKSALVSIITGPGNDTLALLDIAKQEIVDARAVASTAQETFIADFYIPTATLAMLAAITNNQNASPYFMIFNPTLLPPVF